jgi:hypothetical protein
VTIGTTGLPLSPVFRESFVRRCAPYDGGIREFGDVLARVASQKLIDTEEWAREEYRAALRELRQAEVALVVVRRNQHPSNRRYHLATIPALRELRIQLDGLEAVLHRAESGK